MQTPQLTQDLRDRLPQPHLPEHPAWEALYWRTWELGLAMIREGTPANGFAPRYVDAAFGGNIFQWDTCFIAAFARYSRELLPVYPALDNFYDRQESDGYIAREYRWENGAPLWPKASGDSCNPPLFAWAEWLMFCIHGDRSRLQRVWQPLQRYYHWLQRDRRLENGLYWITDMGCGMDNTPRYATAWSDYSMQQALNACMMQRIAQTLEDHAATEEYAQEFATLKHVINELMWDRAAGWYWDLDRANAPVRIKTIAPFWALLAGITDQQQTQQLINELQNPEQFWRTHPFPTLAANEPLYKPHGDYWLGAVWAPTNYMVIRGLHEVGAHVLARDATTRHLHAVAAVAERTGTVWENYRADSLEPGIPARPDFVGWTGLGPIALLIESILGIELDTPAGQIHWRVPATPCGIDNLPFGNGRVDLHVAADHLRVHTSEPLVLHLETQTIQTHTLAPGSHRLERSR